MAERPNEAAERLPIHDLGCTCWPHVSQRDAEAVIEAVGLAEYRDGTAVLAAERAAGIDAERLADDVRYGGGNGTSDYWRGFNDGIDRLVERLAAQSEEPTP